VPPGTIDGIRVAAGEGWLRLATVQPEGKGPQPADAWRNGARPVPGERLGTPP
jgi:methionyl-tRNA formyltransferase